MWLAQIYRSELFLVFPIPIWLLLTGGGLRTIVIVDALRVALNIAVGVLAYMGWSWYAALCAAVSLALHVLSYMFVKRATKHRHPSMTREHLLFVVARLSVLNFVTDHITLPDSKKIDGFQKWLHRFQILFNVVVLCIAAYEYMYQMYYLPAWGVYLPYYDYTEFDYGYGPEYTHWPDNPACLRLYANDGQHLDASGRYVVYPRPDSCGRTSPPPFSFARMHFVTHIALIIVAISGTIYILKTHWMWAEHQYAELLE